MLHVERSGQHGIYLQPYEQWFLFQHLWEPKQQHHFRPGQRNGHRGHDRGHGTGVPAENYTVGAGPYQAPVAAVRLSEHLRQAGGVFPQVYVLQLPATNLFSASFFNNAILTSANGTYADLVSATGKSSSTIVLNAVAQLAEAAGIPMTPPGWTRPLERASRSSWAKNSR